MAADSRTLSQEVVVRSILTATLGGAFALLAGCATTHIRTASGAERLERSAEAFVARACHDPNAGCATTRYLPAARAFADRAQGFGRTVHGAGDQDVVLAYKRLWRSYHTLRDEVDRSRDRQARADLKPVTRAFVDVELLVKNGYSYADPTVYASGGYTFDPYYN
jgi:hypothetical protein